MTDYSEYCAPETRWEETYIEVTKGVSLRTVFFSPVEVNKSLPAVVFVAGWISHISSWQRVLRQMTRTYRVVYVETREKISSRVTGKAEFGVEAIGQDLIRLIPLLDLKDKPYILVGSSLGATAILEACRRHNLKPLGLILVGPNAVFRVPWLGKVVIILLYPGLYLLFKPFVKWYLRTFRMDVESDRAQYEKYCRALDAADPWKLKRAIRLLWSYQVWDYLEEIGLPALIFGASKDSLHEPDNLKRMATIMPKAEYVDLETNHRTHGPEMVDAFQNFVRILIPGKNASRHNTGS
jgi:pimeloyl-ACP methyl ester carboxylesterase